MGKFRTLLIVASFLLLNLCAQSPEWYSNHSFENRYEGLFGENQGSPEWEVRSFIAFIEPYPTDKNAELTIQYYVPNGSKAFIRSELVNRKASYLMEPKQDKLKTDSGWRLFSHWSTKDVLLAKKIRSTDLGVLIRLGADSETVHDFAPAIVYFSNSPKRITAYRFDFFTALALKDFTFDVIGASKYHKTFKHDGVSDRSNVTIEFPASDLPEGPVRVRLNPQFANQDGSLPFDWRFYHKNPQ